MARWLLITLATLQDGKANSQGGGEARDHGDGATHAACRSKQPSNSQSFGQGTNWAAGGYWTWKPFNEFFMKQYPTATYWASPRAVAQVARAVNPPPACPSFLVCVVVASYELAGFASVGLRKSRSLDSHMYRWFNKFHQCRPNDCGAAVSDSVFYAF